MHLRAHHHGQERLVLAALRRWRGDRGGGREGGREGEKEGGREGGR